MKKLLTTLMIGACACAVVPFANVEASAGEKHSLFVTDVFDELNTQNWAVDSASDSIKLFAADDSHISYTKKTAHAEQFAVTTSDKLENLDYFQFDYMHVGKKWNALYFVPDRNLEINQQTLDKFAHTDTYYTYEPNVMLTPAGISGASSTAKVTDTAWEINQKEWYTVRLQVTSATTADVYCVPQGQVVTDSTAVATIALNDKAQYSFHSLYILISCGTDDGQAVHLDNFEVKYQKPVEGEGYEAVTLIENFNGEIGAGIATVAAAGKTYAVEKAASMLSVEAAQKGDSIFYNKAVAEETSILTTLECLDVSTTVSFKEGKTDALSFVFGAKNFDYTKGCVTVDMYANGLKLAQVGADGVKTDLSEMVSTDAFVQEGSVLRVVANKDGTVYVCVNDVEVIRETIDVSALENPHYYAGNFGYAMMEETANTGKVRIDDVQVNITKYKVPVTKSVTHNFSNDYFGNEDYEDFVMNSTGGSQYVKDGKLVWDGISDFSYFGSAHEYDDFILEFKICNILASDKTSDINATGLNRWLGIDIAKSAPGLQEYGSNIVFMFQINSLNESNGIGFYTSSDSPVDRAEVPGNVKVNNPIPSSLFNAISYDNDKTFKTDILEKDAVCVRWVAERGTLRLYLKKACELNYTLYTQIDNVDTTGYVALCCTGFTFLELDDFSMSNISSVYIPADNYVPETIIKTEQTIIYDRGNVDVNGATEAELNQSKSGGGCGSVMNVSYGILPVAIIGAALILKQKKGKEEK